MVRLTVDEDGDWHPASNGEAIWVYSVGYAPSGRARCRKCSEYIIKGKVRFGLPTKDPRGKFGWILCWQHIECTRLEEEEKIDPVKDVYGFVELAVSDQKLVQQELAKQGSPSHWESIDPEEVVKREPGLIPRKAPPAEVLLPMLPFQEEGLAWMCAQEESESRGGILADEMGMGKTIQAIALMCSNRPAPLPILGNFSTGRRLPSKTTLVITPTSAMVQWKEEIVRHTDPGSLSVFVYHEKRAGVTAEHLATHDVVLTTYPVVEAEWRAIINRFKVPCPYCNRKFLRRRLVVHQKFFCGPDAVRSLRLQKTEKKRKRAMAKGMRTLQITKEADSSSDESDDEGDSEAEEEDAKTSARSSRRASIPTPSVLYRELMQSAGRKAHSMFTTKASLNANDVVAGHQEGSKKRQSSGKAVAKTEAPSVKPEHLDVEDAVQPDACESTEADDRKEWLKSLDRELQLRIKGKSFETLTVSILRDICLGLGLPPNAKRKDELVQRIMNHTERPITSTALKAEEGVTHAFLPSSTRNASNLIETDSDVIVVRRTRSSKPPLPKKVKPEPPSSPAPQPQRKVKSEPKEAAQSSSTTRGRRKAPPTSPQSPPSSDYFVSSKAKKESQASSKKESKGKRCKKELPAELQENEIEELEDVAGDGVDLSDSPLHSLMWHRVILDEAHKIKGRTTSTAKSVYSLHSHLKWCLTGTPLQNRVGELYSLVRFLRMEPFAKYFCDKKGCDCTSFCYQFGPQARHCDRCGHSPMLHFSYFNRHVINPIKRYGYIGDGRRAMQTLKEKVLDKVLLRRTKVERAADVKLPPLNIRFEFNELDAQERDFYENIYKRSRSQFDTYVDRGTLLNNYAHIFDLLSRLRQAVDHPYLVIHGNLQKAAEGAAPRQEPVSIPTRSAGNSDVCGICQDDVLPSVCVAAQCKHPFHRDCMAEYIETAPQLPEGGVGCPVCFVPLSVDLRPEGVPALAGDGASSSSAKPIGRKSILQKVNLEQFASSTKVERLASMLQDIQARTPDAKSIVFSQFANMLHIVEWRLQKAGIRTVMLMGSLPVSMRQSMLRAFRDDPNIKVILISLKAGGEGLNLQVASNVFLLDPWWNPAVELQAIQRAHRIGQTKEVTAVRFVTRDTIEERMMQLQEKKQLVFSGTIDGEAKSIAQLTEEDLRFLFTN